MIRPFGYIHQGLKVEFYVTPSGRSPVEDFIKCLPLGDKERFRAILEGIEKEGVHFSRAQFKPLTGKLWEVKFSAPSGGFRIAYFIRKGGIMVIVHAFRKATQKTPHSDLDLAVRRMKELMDL